VVWNTDASSIPAGIPDGAHIAARVEGKMGSFGKLFTSYSHVEPLAPAVRRETIFDPKTRQENLPRGALFYFVETVTFS
jgi:hypothetical protein